MKTEGFENPHVEEQRLYNDLYNDTHKYPGMKGKKKANLPDNLQASWLVGGSQSNCPLDHFLRKEDILQTPEKKQRGVLSHRVVFI